MERVFGNRNIFAAFRAGENRVIFVKIGVELDSLAGLETGPENRLYQISILGG